MTIDNTGRELSPEQLRRGEIALDYDKKIIYGKHPVDGSIVKFSGGGMDGGSIDIDDVDGLPTALDGKVDKEPGKGLSEVNFSQADKNKLDTLDDLHKGEFVSLSALQAAWPVAAPGSTADVDGGVGSEIVRYIWDSSDNEWVKQGGTPPEITAAEVKTKYESNANTNAFTDSEKIKLANIEPNATQNSPDADLLNRSNHTGTQPISTVTNLQTTLNLKVDNDDARLSDAREWIADLVSQAEAQTGTSTTPRKWSALRVFQSVAAWWENSTHKSKLDGIEAGATANYSDSYLLDRSNHTGVQPQSTVDGLVTALSNINDSLEGKVDKVTGKQLSTEDYTTAEKNKLAGIEAGAEVNPNIIDNLSSNSVVEPLSANQGRVLKQFIDAINDLLQSDDSTLDELQEIVDFIKANREDLENLSISNIAGLESALDGKQPLDSVLTNTTASFTTALKNKLDAIAAGATANATDAYLLNRSNHTGTQAISTITGLLDALNDRILNNDPRLSDAREWIADVVSQSEAEAGSSTTARKWTSLRVRQAIASWWSASAMKTKLDGIEANATSNSTDAHLLSRANHTGTQGMSTVTGLVDALDGKVDTSDARLTNSREWTASTVTQVEAEEGTATTRRAWTAQRVRQAILGWWNASAAKSKLDGIQAGATANQTDAYLLNRANHTGTQAISTIDGLSGALDAKVDKVTGYGLSQENFTPAEKSKLAGLESSHFKGVFASLAALQSGVTSPAAGDYADVDAGAGQDVSRYIWDTSDAKWVKQAGEAGSLTASQVKTLYESNPDTNAYTDAEKSKLASVAMGATSNTGTVTSVQVEVPAGLQVAGGPVTTSGTLTISYQTGYSIPANNKQSQWDTAYGWGDHAQAGYALSSSLATVATSGSYGDLSDKPTLGTAAAKDAPSSGNATSTQVVLGNDTRLTNSRNPTAHTHPISDVEGLGAALNAKAPLHSPAFTGLPTAESIRLTMAAPANPNDSNAWPDGVSMVQHITEGWAPEDYIGVLHATINVNRAFQLTVGANGFYVRRLHSSVTNAQWQTVWTSANLNPNDFSTPSDLVAYTYDRDEIDALISAATSGGWVWQATTTTLAVNTPSKVDFTTPRTLTLPASPAENDYVAIVKTAGNTYGSTIARNGSTIMGVAENMVLDVDISYIRLYYVDGSWRIS